MNELKQHAEALVECGYAERCSHQGVMGWMIFGENQHAEVQAFADTLEGRRQADALEDWLYHHHEGLWEESHLIVELPFNAFKWRLDRIKWCFKELNNE